MNCEEFELVGLDAGRPDANVEEQRDAASHAAVCAKCHALLASWEEVRADLRLLREETNEISAPARVEMRLLNELQSQRRPVGIFERKSRIVAWALAAAAVLVGAVSWINWKGENNSQGNIAMGSQMVSRENASSAGTQATDNGAWLAVGNYNSGDFVALPGSLPITDDSASVFRVNMQRAALGSLGLPVDEQRAGEWVQVDLVVGGDGVPQAVRLHDDSVQESTLQ